MIVDFLLFGLLFYLSIPAVAGYVAHSYGRSFWLWFSISCFLPIITHIILYVLLSVDSHPRKSKFGLTNIESRKLDSIMEEVDKEEKELSEEVQSMVEESKIKYQ